MEKAKRIITTLLQSNRERVRIAIQKDGKLNLLSWAALKSCVEAAGGELPERAGNDRRSVLKIKGLSREREVILLRNTDIPKYVENGAAQAAIIGEDQVLEQGAQVTISARLGEAKCTLQAMVKKNSTIQKMEDLDGKTVATSLPNITKTFLNDSGIRSATIKEFKGVEDAVDTDQCQAGFDIVETGESMRVRELRSIGVVKNFEALLITN